MTEFIMVDGEGVTRPDGTHDYVLLSVGNRSFSAHGDRLSFTQIAAFLYRQHQLHPDACFAGYYLSYDFTHWLRDIPADSAFMLFSDKGVALRRRKTAKNPDPWPVRFAGWEFDIMGMRRFKLRPAMQSHLTRNVYSWMYICDAGPFWQTSFLNAINPKNWPEPICTQEEYDVIREGKTNRASAVFDAAMVRYNVAENRAGAAAMRALDSGFRAEGWGLNKKQWFGPGQAAERWLRSIQAPCRDDILAVTPLGVMEAAQASYYGGWFEIPRHGHIPGESYEYDINSAYPAVIAGLPCLLHGRWTHTSSDVARKLWRKSGGWNESYVLAYVTAHGSDRYIGPLPHRNRHGIISRPLTTEGWYWAHEIDAARKAGLLNTYTVSEMWTYHVPACECGRPFADIARLYRQRLSIGKNTPHGKALKLVYNSAYGKFAQSVGSPRYANPIYASLITAGCRTEILRAIATHPVGARDVLMVATDGIYFRTRHPSLNLSPTELGAWDETIKRNLTLFMPGVYWDDHSREHVNSDMVQLKSRGINAYELAQHIDRIDTQFNNNPLDGWPVANIPVRFSLTTAKLAQHRGKWSTCGTITTTGVKTLSSDPSNKRIPDIRYDDGLLTTRPYTDRGVSAPYSRAFGANLDAAIDNDAFITDDGTINYELVEALGNV